MRLCPGIPELKEGPGLGHLIFSPAWCQADHTFLEKRDFKGGSTPYKVGTAFNCHLTTNLEAAVCPWGDEFIIESNTTWTVGVNMAGFSISVAVNQ